MLSMRQSYRMIPVYTADVSGVCSALYELGGMTVMHDPSGCNSTYNTHDEIRWYDQDSLIFISGLTEIDAIMGNDRKFIDDIEYAARELHPKFIALAGSPIPFMNGTDFPAIARVIETETGIPAFSVPTNGMNDYVYGAGIALEEIAKRFVRETDRQENRDPSSRTVNLLGVTPLDFGPQKNVETLKENLQKYGWQVMSVWAMGDDLKTLQRSAEADVNLVVGSRTPCGKDTLGEVQNTICDRNTKRVAGRRYFKCTGACSHTAGRAGGCIFAEPHAAGGRYHAGRRTCHYGIISSRD